MNRPKKPNRNRLRHRQARRERARRAGDLTPLESARQDHLLYKVAAEVHREEAAETEDPNLRHFLNVMAQVFDTRATKAQARMERISGRVLNAAAECGKVEA